MVERHCYNKEQHYKPPLRLGVNLSLLTIDVDDCINLNTCHNSGKVNKVTPECSISSMSAINAII